MSEHNLINQGLRRSLIENSVKPLEPILILICAGLYAGGDWGVFKFFESLVFLLFRINVLSLDRALIWFYAQDDERTYLREIGRVIAFCGLVMVLLLGLVVAARLGWIPLLSDFFFSRNKELQISLQQGVLFFANVPLMVLTQILCQVNINKGNFSYDVWARSISFPLITYGGGLALYFYNPTSSSLGLCFLVGNAVSAIILIYGFVQTHRPRWSDLGWRPWPETRLIHYSSPLAMAEITGAIAVRMDVFMVTGLIGLKALEVYNIVAMIGKSLQSLRKSFDSLLLSAMSSASGGRVTLRVSHYFGYGAWLAITMQMVVAFLLALFAQPLLALIHPQYAAGYWPLLITAAFIMVNTYADFSTLLLLGIGRTGITPWVQAVLLAGNVYYNYSLIPIFGLSGAAMALGLANTTGGTIYLLYLSRFTDHGIWRAKYLLSLGTQVLLYGSVLLAVFWLAPEPQWLWGIGALGVLPLAWMHVGGKYRQFNQALKLDYSSGVSGK